VQSTHAGAEYGLSLIPIVLVVYLLKYPFFEFAQRYYGATQETLLQGYQRIGRWALLLYIILVSCAALPTLAVLSLVTANVTAYVFNTTVSPLVISIALLSICTLILTLGRYLWLNATVKVIMAILIAASLATFFIAVPQAPHVFRSSLSKIDFLTEFTFLVALMGWMPAPLEVSAWTTLWSKARSRALNKTTSLKDCLIDFNVGYGLSVILITIFIALGAFVMFASSQSFSRSGYLFIEQLITLFTTHIGRWGVPFIATLIFSVLYSTTLTCLDAYPRAITSAITLVLPKSKSHTEIIYWLSIITLFLCSILLSGYFLRSMQELVQIATILAFLTAPVFGYLNYKVVTKFIAKDKLPPKYLMVLSKIGLFFLVVISLLFIVLFVVNM
jgi:Mn2+/Fe2+ NRAMP family transporter